MAKIGSWLLTTVATFLSLVCLILACSLRFQDGDGEYVNNWWPLFITVFYLIAVIPQVFCGAIAQGDEDARNGWLSFGEFLMATVLTSIFGFPSVLFKAGIITFGAFAFSIASALIMVLAQTYVIFVQVREDEVNFM